MEPFLFFPVKNPINQSNLFGANPAQYKPLGQNGHPGNDFEAPTGTPIYSPCDGNAFYCTDSLGGDGIWIRTTDASGQNYNIILWHMPTPADPAPQGVTSAKDYPFQIPTDRSIVPVKAGQLLGYSDDSGYHPAPQESESTGPHLHLGVMPADKNWIALAPNNGFLGCSDPTPFYTGKFAQDIAIEQQVVEKTAAVVSLVSQATDQQIPHAEKLSILQTIEQFIKSLIP